MAKPQRFCIYCSGPGLSKEHVWPQWLAPYITNRSARGQYTAIDLQTHKTVSSTSRAGDVHSHSLRAVCKKCNNGWMSVLQQDAKPLVVAMIERKRVLLGEPEQKLLARFLTLMAMTGQFFNREIALSPQSDRDFLRLNECPPPRWYIQIGTLESNEWSTRWYHRQLAGQGSPEIRKLHNINGDEPDTHITSFAVGPIYAWLRSSIYDDIGDIRILAAAGRRRLRQIWPVKDKVVEWPVLFKLSDADVDALATSPIINTSKPK